MCCEHLVCASCAQPVADARCGVCRATRNRMHPHVDGLPTALLLLLAALLLTLAAVAQTTLGR